MLEFKERNILYFALTFRDFLLTPRLKRSCFKDFSIDKGRIWDEEITVTLEGVKSH